MKSIWATLGIARTGDRTTIRRAYAEKLKVTNPEDDPDGFQALREAYEWALQQAGTVTRIRGIDVVRLEDSVASPVPEALPEPAVPEASEPGRAPEAASPAPDAAMLKMAEALKAIGETAKSGSVLLPGQAHLEGVLKPDSDAGDAARLEALRWLLQLPDLEHIETYTQTEAWLVQLLLDNIPRSDALIGVARRRFGWSEDSLDRSSRPGETAAKRRQFEREAALKKALLEREKDVLFLRNISNPDSDYFNVYRVVSQPPERQTLWRRMFAGATQAQIAKFLQQVRRQHPGVESDLDAGAVAHWEARAERPTLAGVHLAMAVLAVPSLVLMLVLWGTLGASEAGKGSMPFFTAILAGPALWALGWLAHAYLYVVPRRKWRNRAAPGAGPWKAYGWGGVLVALFLIAAGPPTLWLAGLVFGLALLVAWWVLVVGDPDIRASNLPLRGWPLLGCGSLIVWWAFSIWNLPRADSKLLMTIAVLAALPVYACGWIPLYKLWSGWAVKTRRAALAGVAGLCLAAISGMWLVLSYPAWQPLAFGTGAIALILPEIPSVTGRAWSKGFGPYLIGIVALCAVVTQSTWLGQAIIGTALLLRTTVDCLVAFAQIEAKPRKRSGTA